MMLNSPDVSTLRNSILRVSIRDSLQRRTTLEKLTHIYNQINGSVDDKDSKDLLAKMRTANQKDKIKIKDQLEKEYKNSTRRETMPSTIIDKENADPNPIPKFISKQRQIQMERHLKMKSKLDSLNNRLKIDKHTKTDRFYQRNVKPFLHVDSYIDVHKMIGKSNSRKATEQDKKKAIHNTVKEIKLKGRELKELDNLGDNETDEDEIFYMDNYAEYYPPPAETGTTDLFIRSNDAVNFKTNGNESISPSRYKMKKNNQVGKKFFGLNLRLTGKIEDFIDKEVNKENTDQIETEDLANGIEGRALDKNFYLKTANNLKKKRKKPVIQEKEVSTTDSILQSLKSLNQELNSFVNPVDSSNNPSQTSSKFFETSLDENSTKNVEFLKKLRKASTRLYNLKLQEIEGYSPKVGGGSSKITPRNPKNNLGVSNKSKSSNNESSKSEQHFNLKAVLKPVSSEYDEADLVKSAVNHDSDKEMSSSTFYQMDGQRKFLTGREPNNKPHSQHSHSLSSIDFASSCLPFVNLKDEKRYTHESSEGEDSKLHIFAADISPVFKNTNINIRMPTMGRLRLNLEEAPVNKDYYNTSTTPVSEIGSNLFNKSCNDERKPRTINKLKENLKELIKLSDGIKNSKNEFKGEFEKVSKIKDLIHKKKKEIVFKMEEKNPTTLDSPSELMYIRKKGMMYQKRHLLLK